MGKTSMKATLPLLFLAIFLLMIPTVYAADEDQNIDLTQTPSWLATRLTIPLFPAQLLISLIILCFALFPTLVITRNVVAHIIVGLSALSFCVAMQWFPVWCLIVIVFIIALMFADKLTAILGGRKT